MKKNESRQDRVEGLTIPKTVSVVGCGGVGANIAQIVASVKGIREVRLFDFDRFEHHNRERVFIPARFVGKRKDVATAQYLRSIYPKVKFVACGALTSRTERRLKGVVFCATDQLQSQLFAHYTCTKRRLRFIRVGADGNHITVSDTMKGVWGEGGVGYAVPSWRGPVVLAAAKAVCDAFLGVHGVLTTDVRKLGKERHEDK